MKSGYYFSLDALLGAMLLMLGLLMLSSTYIKEETATTTYLAQDTLTLMSGIKVSEINNSYLTALIANGTVTNSNITVLEQIGALWAENKTDYARQLIMNLTGEFIPENVGFAVYADNELIYSNNLSQKSSLYVTKALVSGISKDKPYKGYSSRMALTSVQARTTNSYLYFGGFTGEGNITQRMELPQKITSITEAYIEAESSNNFTLIINSAESGKYTTSGGVGKWNISSVQNFRNGTNTIKIAFNGTGYISGGFLKVKLTTGELNDTEAGYFQTTAAKREWLPGIEGIINIYSSIYIPGNISTMTAHLHYNSPYLTFMTIGNSTVYSSQAGGAVTADITNTEMAAKLNYTALGQRTIPLRIGSGSGNQTITGAGTADVVLANDLSGSMEWCSGTICSTSVLGPQKYCNTIANYRPENGTYCDWWTENYTIPGQGPVCSGRWHAHCTSNDSRKIDIALNASKIFGSTILGTAGNRLGVVEYTNQWNAVIPANGTWTNRYAPFPDSIAGRENLTDNLSIINSHIETYMDAYWGTCICCGVEASVDILTKLSNTSRKRSMVVMSDGEATDKCTGVGTGNAKTDAIEAAQDACTNYNITVYTVGFGTDVDAETLQDMAACNGSYYNATNVTQLAEVYRQIAGELVAISYSAQQINISGTGNTNTTLYDDSYIEINYTPAQTAEFNRIPVTLETDRFGNNITTGTVTIPENATITAARVTSYSGNKWTDNLTVNGQKAFSLSDWGNDYVTLGDPFIADSPASLLHTGDNGILIKTATGPGNASGGSPDNRAIYTLNIDTTTSYTQSQSTSEGCHWQLQFEDGSSTTIKIPADYSGTKTCNYQTASYSATDSIDVSAYSLFQKLDLEKNGKLNIILSQEDINIETATVQGVPSLWGPAVIEARVWQ
ncbi:VWA domain-containing protein [Candidatus Woesearchaeota archaeon]|nr:VWA domain-containing protein [Candidatus Woesearchaeota archaeon]